MLDPLRRTFLAGLGVAAFTKEKLDRLIQELVDRGELSREQASNVTRYLWQHGGIRSRRLASKLYRQLESLLGHGPLATSRALRSLEERVQSLERSLRDSLDSSRGGGDEGPRSADDQSMDAR